MQSGQKRLICAIGYQNGKSGGQKKQDHISFDRDRSGKERKLQIIKNQYTDSGDHSDRREAGIRQEPGEVFLRRLHQEKRQKIQQGDQTIPCSRVKRNSFELNTLFAHIKIIASQSKYQASETERRIPQ